MLIALTGGIGSGKSTVASEWVRLGATEIDADVLAREVVEPGTEGLRQVVLEFGPEVLSADGSLDRAALAEKAFSSPEKRQKLESILHPLIQQLALGKVEKVQGVIVYTIPLFVEGESKLKFDKVVTISCPEAVRLKRLVSRGFTEEQARARIASQATDAQREAVADVVIDSHCEKAELLTKAKQVYLELTNG
jgi:dephospho-CoA kinase